MKKIKEFLCRIGIHTADWTDELFCKWCGKDVMSWYYDNHDNKKRIW